MTTAQRADAIAILTSELRGHRGRGRAINSRELSQVLFRQGGIELCSRGVRRLLSEIEQGEEFTLLLGAEGGHGYFIVEVVDDALDRHDRLCGLREQLGMLIDAYSRRAQLLGFDLPALSRQRNERRCRAQGRPAAESEAA